MINEINYHGWKALELETEKVSLIAPLDVGPRILGCSLKGKDNLFFSDESQLGKSGESEFCLRGGHRLWHSPEDPVRTYETDNDAVEYVVNGDSFTLTGAPEKNSGMQKIIHVEKIDEQTFKLTHHLKNHGVWNVDCSAWCLTVMAHGGQCVIPLPPKGSHTTDLLPNSTIIPWTYTDFAKDCWRFHDAFLRLDSSKVSVPQKIGISNYPGWSAYYQPSGTFVKYSSLVSGVEYPDFNSAFEAFGNEDILELETLSPLIKLQPGKSIEHVEYWGVLDGIKEPSSTESYSSSLKPAVQSWLNTLP